MTDIEYILMCDSREKKANGRGDRNKKRQGGRYVHFQNDHMSRKEWRKMNGTVKSYDMGKMMAWNDFKALPDDIAEEYLKRILKCFPKCPQQEIAKAMEVSVGNFHNNMKKRSLTWIFKKGGDRKTENSFYKSKAWIQFEDWKAGRITLKDLDNSENEFTAKVVETEAPEVTVPEVVEEPEIVVDTPEKENVQKADVIEAVKTEMSGMTLADIVNTLRGLGLSAEINISIKV